MFNYIIMKLTQYKIEKNIKDFNETKRKTELKRIETNKMIIKQRELHLALAEFRSNPKIH